MAQEYLPTDAKDYELEDDRMLIPETIKYLIEKRTKVNLNVTDSRHISNTLYKTVYYMLRNMDMGTDTTQNTHTQGKSLKSKIQGYDHMTVCVIRCIRKCKLEIKKDKINFNVF